MICATQLEAVLISPNQRTIAFAERALQAFHFKTQVFRQPEPAIQYLKAHSADLILAETEDQAGSFARHVRNMGRRQVLVSIATNSLGMREALQSGSHFVFGRVESVDPFMAVLRAASGLILKNRRTNFRIPAHFEARVRGMDRDLGSGKLVNLSENGLCLELAKPVTQDEILSISFTLPGKTPVHVSATVRWMKQGKIGVQFSRIEQAQKAALQEWLEERFSDLLVKWNPVWKFTAPNKAAG